MIKGKARLGAFLLVLVLAAPAFAGLPDAGAPAPRFALRDFYDNSQLLTSRQLFAGKTTLLSFFATWCKPCKVEIPEFQRLQETYGERGFQVVLVCVDRLGAGNVRRYLEEAGADQLQVLWDKLGRVSQQYGVIQLPANFVIGPDETLELVWEGFQTDKLETLASLVRGLPRAAGKVQPQD